MQAYDAFARPQQGGDAVTPRCMLRVACFGLCLGVLAPGNTALGQEPAKVRTARLAFPSMSSLLLDVAIERGIDKKHQLELETVSQNAVPAYYASIANGEADLIVGG